MRHVKLLCGAGPLSKWLALSLAAAAVCAAIPGAAQTAAEPSIAKEKANYDLSGLPDYVPERVEDTFHCHNASCKGEWGLIRIQASENFQELISSWQNAFLKLHPNVKFADLFSPSGIGGLVSKTYDIGILGHAAWRSDFVAFRDVYGHDPLEIRLNGAFDWPKGIQPAPVFIVSKDNPLTSLTLDQIDGIFGAERTGGWSRNFQWSSAAARGPERNIRTWGELGLGREWADKPIHPYGFDATLSGWSHLIEQVAFRGGDKWNPAIVEMVRGGKTAAADAQIAQAVAADKYAIGFNLMKVVRLEPGLKVIPVARDSASPAVMPSSDSIFQRSYPLTNNVYIYLDRAPGKPLPPRLREFLTFVLGKQGQQLLAAQGSLVPLNAVDSRREIAKLH